MCGLVYVRRKDGKPANRSVRKRYFKQKHRGSSGFGYVAIKDNQVVSYKRAPNEHEIMEMMRKETAPEILFHHRFPTSTPNMEEQAHPLFVDGGGLEHQYLVAHNGVIRNPTTRKIAHEALGFKYLTELKPYLETVGKKLYHFGNATFNDSESIAVDTALALEGKVKNIDAEGAAAVIGFTLDDHKVVDRFFYRNKGNPLIYHDDHVMTTLTSLGSGKEVEAIWIMRLKDDGSIEEHPIKVWTPWQYRESVHTSSGHGNPVLPARTGNVSTWPKNEDLSTILLPKDDDFEYGNNDPEYSDSEMSSFVEDGQRDLLLASLPIETLWDEATKAEQAEKELNAALIRFDARAFGIGTINDEVIKGYSRLQKRLDRVKAYGLRVCMELQERETAGQLQDRD